MLKKTFTWLGYGVAALLVMLVMLALLYRFILPPTSLLMLQEGVELRLNRPLERLGNNLPAAVIAAEDSRFCQHWGFDFDAIEAAIEHNQAGGRLRGASTISMQTAKNVFLTDDRSWLRKAFEVPLTILIEILWGKRRIMEIYLNVVEWGPGIFGAEAAAKHYFNKPAAALSRREAAILAALLPSPRRWRPHMERVQRRASIIAERAAMVRRDQLADCVQND